MAFERQETILPPEETERLIQTVADRLYADITHPEKRVVVGIHRGGAILAKKIRDRLAERLAMEIPLGFLDISFYRDDLDTVGPNPVLSGTDLPMSIDDKRIILVDDVLFTGRTIRAALNALFEFGRPELVDLTVLVDRGRRQLPIQPDYRGLKVKTGDNESIKVLEGEDGRHSVIRRY